MKANYTIKNFAKRLVMVLAVGLMAVNAWGATYTAVASLTDGKSYILVAGGYAITAASSTSNWIDGTDVSSDISGSTLTTTATNIVWVAKKYTGSGTTWSFKNGTNYIQNNAGSTYRNMTCGGTESKYTISSNKIYSTGSGATGKYLNYVSPSGFRMYNSNQGSYTFTFYELDEACAKNVAVSSGSNTQVSSMTFSSASVATCSSTASDRQVTVTLTPNTGYTAPTNLTLGGTVTPSKVSGPTGSGPYTYVYQFAQNANGTTTFGATCTGKQCTVTFDKNGGSDGTNSVTATYGSAMTTITPPTREHYDFAGYYDSETDNDGTGNKYYNADGTSAATWNKNTTSNTTLYAKWTEHSLTNYRTSCASTYDIVLHDNNGGSHNGSATVAVNGTTLTNITPPTKSGFVVEGYYDDDSYSHKVAASDGTLQANVTGYTGAGGAWTKGSGATLYAKWTASYTVTYNANGGDGTMTDSNSPYASGSTVTVLGNSFTAPTGQEFDHWNTAANNSGTSYNPSATFTISANTILYAQWRDVNYNVTYSAPSNGNYTIKVADGAASSANKTANYNQTITIAATPSSGYQFVSWTIRNTSTSADVTSTLLGANSTNANTTFTMPAYGVTITATFGQVYTVTFVHHDKGTYSGGSTEWSVPANDNTITLPTVTGVSCGFYDTFEGWIASGSEYSESTSKPATVYAGGSSYTVTDDITLRALYSKCEGAGGQSYHKVTAIGDVTDGTYILVSNAATPTVYSGHSGSNTYGDCVTGLTADGDDYSSTLPSGAVQVTVTRGTGGNASKFTIHNGSKYIVAGTESTGTSDSESWWQLTTGSNVNSKACPAGVIQPASYTDNVLQENNTYYRFRTYKNSQTAYVFLYKLIDKCTKYYATNPSCVKPVGVHITYNKNAGDATMSCSTSNRHYKNWDTDNQYPKLASAYTFCDNATRPGYTLVGWNTQANGLGTTYELDHSYSNLPVSGDLDGDNYVTLTVYAMWAPSVSFNVGNATGGTGVPAVVEEDGGFMLPEPTAAQIGTIPCGYSFYGWSESSVVATTTKPTLYMPGTKYTGSYRTLYAVYRLAGEGGNPDLFSLSYMYNSTKYYVAKPTDITTAPSTWGSDKVKKFSATTDPEEALAFGTKSIGGKTVKSFYWMYDEEEVYVYWKNNAGSLTHANEEDTDYGWTISGTTDLTFSTTYPGQTARQIVFTAPSYGDPATFNASTSTATSLHKEEASTTTYTYATNPSCETTATLSFVTNGGTLNYPTAYDASNYVDLTVGTSVYLPTATYPGEWTFEGWMKGSAVTSTDLRPESANFYTVTLNTTTYSAAPAGTTTFYAVYSKTVNDKQFDPDHEGTYKLFAIMSDGTTKKYMPVWDGTQTTLTPVTSCASTGDYTITPGTGVHAGQYQITHGSYTLGVRSDGDTQFKNVADTWWNIEASTSGKGTYRITVVGSSNRCLSHGGTGFFGNYTRNDVNNPSQPGYRDMEIGECIYTEYTSTPENIPYITITGSPIKITSTNGERVYAPTTLHVEAHNFTGTRRINFSATNGFATNPAYVNCLANGSYSGNIQVYYEPTTDGTGNIVSSVLTASQATESVTQTFAAIQGRNMPANFVIAVKSGTQWYALPDDCHSSGTPKAVAIEVNDPSAPTAATLVPHNTEWRLSDVVNSNSRPKDKVYFYEPNSTNDYTLYAGSAPSIQTNAQLSGVNGDNSYHYEWGLSTTDLCAYTISNADVNKNISINESGNFGTHATNIVSSTLYLLPITAYYEPAKMQVLEWKANSVVVMYTGTQTSATTTVGANSASSAQTLASRQLTHAVYELTTGQDLTANAGEALKVSFGSGAEIIYVTIPIIINSAVTASESHESQDVVIVNGGKLTAASTKYSFHNIYVYGGGKLKIASGSQLGVNNIIMRAGGVTTNGSGGSATYVYIYPQVELGGTLTSTVADIKYEYITDYDHWYHFCLPFNANLNTIHYPQEYYGDNVTAANTGSWVIKRYAGEIRATGSYDAWKDIETEGSTSVTAGKGYIFWGAPKKVGIGDATKVRQQWGIQRISMATAASSATTAETNNKNIAVDSYSEVATSTKPNDQGWNLVGNPYMVNLTGLSSESLIAGQLVHSSTVPWDGKWVNNGDGVRYVTIPDNHFDTYTAQTMSWFTEDNPMLNGRVFFVQIAEGASTLTFAAANRASLMPALYANVNKSVDIETGIVMSDETHKDEVNFWIKDGKTDEYEYNADYPKTPNMTNFNIYGVHSHGELSWVAISPEIANGSMAIGYQVPTAGDYVLSLSETYVSSELQHVFVTDHGVSPEITTDLMEDAYIFHVDQAETNDERFTVSFRLKELNQEQGIEDVRPTDDTPQKFLYRDKIYILRGGVIYDATGKQVQINK